VLGISFDTLLRQLRAGRVRAERIARPEGYAWRVYVDVDESVSRDATREAPGPAQPHTDAPTDALSAEAMAACARSLFEPLVRRAEQQAVSRD
jgi:hypothetical protein